MHKYPCKRILLCAALLFGRASLFADTSAPSLTSFFPVADQTLIELTNPETGHSQWCKVGGKFEDFDFLIFDQQGAAVILARGKNVLSIHLSKQQSPPFTDRNHSKTRAQSFLAAYREITEARLLFRAYDPKFELTLPQTLQDEVSHARELLVKKGGRVYLTKNPVTGGVHYHRIAQVPSKSQMFKNLFPSLTSSDWEWFDDEYCRLQIEDGAATAASGMLKAAN